MGFDLWHLLTSVSTEALPGDGWCYGCAGLVLDTKRLRSSKYADDGAMIQKPIQDRCRDDPNPAQGQQRIARSSCWRSRSWGLSYLWHRSEKVRCEAMGF